MIDHIPSLLIASQLLMATVAGLLLNLTPCVLPAIPIKVRTILREAGSHDRTACWPHWRSPQEHSRFS